MIKKDCCQLILASQKILVNTFMIFSLIKNKFIIPFVFDNWSEKYQWWIPNTVPADFVIDGIKQFPATHSSRWFDLRETNKNISEDEIFDCPAVAEDFLFNYKNIRYTTRSNLDNGQKYIFPVLVHVMGYFEKHKNIKFNYVSDIVINDVKNNRAKIVVMYPWEGNCGQQPEWSKDFEHLNQWCVEKELTKDQVYFIHGNWKIPPKINSYNFTYIPIHAFYSWLGTKVKGIIKYKPVNDQNLFLLYNRRWDKHRQILVSEVIKEGMLSRGLVSYTKQNNAVDAKSYGREDLIEVGEYLDKTVPLLLDEPDLANVNPVNEIHINHHEQTFVSIVAETLYKDGTWFYSEKTWKPILAGQPFFLLSTVGALGELKRHGYKTFDQWWDESYDNESNLDNRIKMIVTELSKLSKLDVKQLIQIRQEMSSVLEYNQNLFLSNRNKFIREWDCMYSEIKKIWGTF